ncbi:MAG: hypothetical protein ACOYMV_12590, partial [Verrucomicrobiia bacterium]
MIHTPSVRLAIIALTVLGLLATAPSPVAALTLVENGVSLAGIVIATDAPQEVQDAAAELSRVLEKMSGAKLAVLTVPAGGAAPAGPRIALGAPARQMGLKLEKTSRAKDGYRFKVQGNAVLIDGESPSGVYTGAMRFLESLGCGWYTPGDVGEVIPRKVTVTVPDATDVAEVSNSINRRFWYGGGSKGRTPKTDAW